VAHNENAGPLQFAVREGGQQFTYTLPAQSIVTFTWPGPGPDSGAYALRQVAPSGWTATASPSPAAGSGDEAANAADGDASTRYSTQTGQAAGQYLQLDFGREIQARRVVFDTGASLGDYPRGYTAQVSTDGTHWTTVVANAAGTGQFTTVGLSGQPVRYVRVTLTASSGSWWSVADVRAYTAG
jgi:glucosylceramidase